MPRQDTPVARVARVVDAIQRISRVAQQSATIIKGVEYLTDANFTNLAQRVRAKFSTPLRELLGARNTTSLYEGKGARYPQSARLRSEVKQIGPGKANFISGNKAAKHGPTIKLAFSPKGSRGGGLDYILDSYKSYRKDRFPSYSARRNYHTGKRYKRKKRLNFTLKARCARKGNRPKECKQFRY